MKLKLILPDDVSTFDIFCYNHEGTLISMPTIHINKDLETIEIFKENGIYYTIKFSKRKKELEKLEVIDESFKKIN